MCTCKRCENKTLRHQNFINRWKLLFDGTSLHISFGVLSELNIKKSWKKLSKRNFQESNYPQRVRLKCAWYGWKPVLGFRAQAIIILAYAEPFANICYQRVREKKHKRHITLGICWDCQCACISPMSVGNCHFFSANSNHFSSDKLSIFREKKCAKCTS